MLNGEKFKKEIEDVDYDLAKCKGKIVNCCTTNCVACDFYDKERGCGPIFVKWLLEEYKDPILDDIEKEYLSAVVKPFRKRIKSIKKTGHPSNSAFISIAMDKCEHIFLPVFELNSGMYQRMEINKEYTLKDLGL